MGDGRLLTCGGSIIERGVCVTADCLPVVGMLLSGWWGWGRLLTCGRCYCQGCVCVMAHCLPVLGVILSGVCVCRHIAYLW